MNRYRSTLVALCGIALAALAVPAQALPANDDRSNAIPVALLGGVRGSNVDSVWSGPEGCSGNYSIWFRYTHEGQAGTVVADTGGSGFDTTLGVYVGSATTPLVCNDDAGGSSRSRVRFSANTDATYYLRVAGYGSARGLVALSLDVGDALLNGATVSSVPGSNSLPASPPPSCGPILAPDRFYRVATTGTVTIDTFGSTYDTILQVYRSPGFTPVVCNDDHSGTPQSRVSFTASAGVRYYVLSSGANGAHGTLRLTASGSNDLMPNALTAPPAPGTPAVDSIERVDGDVTLSWTPSGSSPSTHYVIARQVNGWGFDDLGVVPAPAATFTDTHVPDYATSLAYRVKAAGPGGESIYSNSLSVDLPTVAITSSPQGWVTDRTARIHFESPTGTSFLCSYDGAPSVACGSPVRWISIDDGFHSFVVRAVDAGGPGPIAGTWIDADGTGPSMTLVERTPAGPGGWNRDDVRVRWSCEDPLSGPVEPTVSVVVSGTGEQLVAEGTCTDNAGNSTTASEPVKIDRLDPETTVDPQLAVLASAGLTISGTSTDDAAGYLGTSVTFDDGERVILVEATCATGCGGLSATWRATGPVLAPGLYTVTARSTDRAGNVGPPSAPVVILVI
jgi:hypothetical protein